MNETCVAKYGMIFSTCVAADGFPRTERTSYSILQL